VIFDLTEPVLRLVRGLLPPIRMGTMGLDLSPIVVFIALGLIQSVLCGGRFGLGF
jgi:YggT family protein